MSIISLKKAQTRDRQKACQLSLLNTHQSHTYHILHDRFNVCRNQTIFKLRRTRILNIQVAVYISNTSVTLKQGQDHQT